MVKDGVSSQRIRRYLHAWATWWVRTEGSWSYDSLLVSFINTCWDQATNHYACRLLDRYIKSQAGEPTVPAPAEAEASTAAMLEDRF